MLLTFCTVGYLSTAVCVADLLQRLLQFDFGDSFAFRYSKSASEKAAGHFVYHSVEYMLSSFLCLPDLKVTENVDVSNIVDACCSSF